MRGKDQPWEKEVMAWAREEVPRVVDALKAAGKGPAEVGEQLHHRFDAWYALRAPRIDPGAEPVSTQPPPAPEPMEPADEDDTPTPRRTRRRRSSGE